MSKGAEDQGRNCCVAMRNCTLTSNGQIPRPPVWLYPPSSQHCADSQSDPRDLVLRAGAGFARGCPENVAWIVDMAANRQDQRNSEFAHGHIDCHRHKKDADGVICGPTVNCPFLERKTIQEFVSRPGFGRCLAPYSQLKVSLYNRVAESAKHQHKERPVESIVWRVRGDNWKCRHVNLCPRSKRQSFQCIPDVYCYDKVEADTLVVDFANQVVGGGCFQDGFVQEEQMVLQSTDFATRLHWHRDVMGKSEVISYTGIHMDAWWPRAEAAKRMEIDARAFQECPTENHVTILAVDAPNMKGHNHYTQDTMEILAKKILLVFAVAERRQSPQIFSGLLGGGAFRNNRPLVLLLHLLLQPTDCHQPILFHFPIFQSFGTASTEDLEQMVLKQADILLDRLEQEGVSTLEQALFKILQWELSSSHWDADLM